MPTSAFTKYAALIAVGYEIFQPVITLDIAKWAQNLVKRDASSPIAYPRPRPPGLQCGNVELVPIGHARRSSGTCGAGGKSVVNRASFMSLVAALTGYITL